jgi:ectoine hydroxylase-related dioxygenase (phytanoyl-CoA dioxygenase family)
MGARYPGVLLRQFLRWNLYVLLPGLTRGRRSARAFRCSDVEAAVRAFSRDGFVVLSDALDPDAVEELRKIVEEKATEIVRLDEAGLLPPEKRHGHNRYSYGEYGHSAEWEYLGKNESVLPVLMRIWEGRGFRAVGAGGDFVLPGGTWQALHNDMSWRAAGERMPRVLTVNYYVTDVQSTNGPIRLVPGTARFPVPPHRVIDRFEPRWMKRSVILGKPGYAIIRDPRVWHGGTPNCSSAPRYMPNIEYVLRDAPMDEIDGDTNVEQLSRGRWIAEFANS